MGHWGVIKCNKVSFIPDAGTPRVRYIIAKQIAANYYKQCLSIVWLAHARSCSSSSSSSTCTRTYALAHIRATFLLYFREARGSKRPDRSASNWYAIAAKPRRESRQLLQTRFHEIRTSIRDAGVRDRVSPRARSIDRSIVQRTESLKH